MSQPHSIQHDQQEPSFKGVLWAIGVSALLVAGVMVGGYLYFLGSLSAEMNQKEVCPQSLEIQQLRHSEHQELLPIDAAMEMVVQKYSTHER